MNKVMASTILSRTSQSLAKTVTVSVISALLLSSCAPNIKDSALSDKDRLSRVDADMTSLFENQEPLNHSIDLYEAIARAIAYNKDKRLKLMEESLADNRVVSSEFGMLPKMVANAGYNGRSNFNAATSYNLTTNTQNFASSTSQEKNYETADLSLAWNVLDFGLSYVRHKQEKNSALVARERHIKVLQNIIMDVRDAYYRATAADRLLPGIDGLLANVHEALAKSEQAQQAKLKKPDDALVFQRELLEKLQDLNDVRRRLALAKVELSALINLRPGAEYSLVPVTPDSFEEPILPGSIRELEVRALVDRPELREEDYQKRISELEIKKAMISMLPGLELNVSGNYTSNEFTTNSNWLGYGSVISKNLFEVISGPANIKVAKASGNVTDARRLALSMAVMTQVHIAYQRYGIARTELGLARKLWNVDNKIKRISDNQLEAGSIDDLKNVEAKTNKTLSELHYYLAYADLQNAYGRILNSIGFNPLVDAASSEITSLDSLAAALRHSMPDWSDRSKELPEDAVPSMDNPTPVVQNTESDADQTTKADDESPEDTDVSAGKEEDPEEGSTLSSLGLGIKNFFSTFKPQPVSENRITKSVGGRNGSAPFFASEPAPAAKAVVTKPSNDDAVPTTLADKPNQKTPLPVSSAKPAEELMNLGAVENKKVEAAPNDTNSLKQVPVSEPVSKKATPPVHKKIEVEPNKKEAKVEKAVLRQEKVKKAEPKTVSAKPEIKEPLVKVNAAPEVDQKVKEEEVVPVTDEPRFSEKVDLTKEEDAKDLKQALDALDQAKKSSKVVPSLQDVIPVVATDNGKN